MPESQIIYILIGLAVVVLIVIMQLKTRPLRENSATRLTIILGVIGVFEIYSAVKGHPLGAWTLTWLAGSLIVGGALGGGTGSHGPHLANRRWIRPGKGNGSHRPPVDRIGGSALRASSRHRPLDQDRRVRIGQAAPLPRHHARCSARGDATASRKHRTGHNLNRKQLGKVLVTRPASHTSLTDW
jgi:hypothetical protein